MEPKLFTTKPELDAYVRERCIDVQAMLDATHIKPPRTPDEHAYILGEIDKVVAEIKDIVVRHLHLRSE